MNGRTITTAEELDALPNGAIVALSLPTETVNVALKTDEDEWCIGGNPRAHTTALLFRAATSPVGYTLTVLSELVR